MADYIESWRNKPRGTQVDRALRAITRDKRASPAQRLEACKLLIQRESERESKPYKPRKIIDLQTLTATNVLFGLSSAPKSQEINELRDSSSND